MVFGIERGSNGLNPKAWLTDVLARMVSHSGSGFDEVLLWNSHQQERLLAG